MIYDEYTLIQVKVNHDYLMKCCESDEELVDSSLWFCEHPPVSLKTNIETTLCITHATYNQAIMIAKSQGVSPRELIERCIAIYLKDHSGSC